jgi:hypothetical protein
VIVIVSNSIGLPKKVKVRMRYLSEIKRRRESIPNMELSICHRAWRATCEDALCENSIEEMQHLQQLGLIEKLSTVTDIPNAIYEFVMTEKGEEMAKKYHQWISEQ